MDREVWAAGNPSTSAPLTPVPLMKKGPRDDLEALLDLFERTVGACEWPQTHWPIRLRREAQIAAEQLPVQNLRVYEDLKRALLQRVGLSS